MITVSFESRYNPHGGWDDDNVSPYIHVANPDNDILNQREPDEIVIPMGEIKVRYRYPLSNPATFTYISDRPEGFTRAHLAREISNGYKRIYREEDETAGDPGNITGMLNRNTSDGPYGIWGHGIGDLAIHTVSQKKGNLFGLGVDS